MASKCTKCGNTESYNFALNIGLCNPCIGERIEELEADSKIKQSVCEAIEKEVTAINEKLGAENDKLRDALVRIDNWAKAYPLDVFPKPDLERAAKVLKAAGMTLDAISGDAMRHVIEGVKDITEQALEGK